MNGPTNTAYFCITATYSDGSGPPDVLLITDNEEIAKSYFSMIQRAEPMKTIAVITPAAAIFTTAPEGNPQ